MLAVIFIALAVTLVARLVTVVMNDRPLTAPRSHIQDLERQSAGQYRAF
jgi:hypothetical protein